MMILTRDVGVLEHLSGATGLAICDEAKAQTERCLEVVSLRPPQSKLRAPSNSVGVFRTTTQGLKSHVRQINIAQCIYPYLLLLIEGQGSNGQSDVLAELVGSSNRPKAIARASVKTPEGQINEVLLLKGRREVPLIRVDDYPTGIRPILDDLGPIHRVIESFERENLSYDLAISPGLLTRDMEVFLRGTRNLKPLLHGLDHSYWHLSPKLRAKGDTFNKRNDTPLMHFIGRIRNKLSPAAHCEFRRDDIPNIVKKLRIGKDRLESLFNREVTCYCPPFGESSPKVGHALDEMDFECYMSQRMVAHTAVPGLKSDFYGNSSEFDSGKNYASICLHTLWEWDLERQTGKNFIPEVFGYVRTKRAEWAALEQSLVHAIQSLG